MRNRAFVVAAVGLGAVLVAGALIASNMGFKANKNLEGPLSIISLSGTNNLGLPYFQQAGLVVVEDLINDINLDTPLGAGDTADNVESITRFVGQTDTTETYSLFTGGTNFSLVPGDGYTVIMRGTLTNYTIVGSHNPVLGINLEDASSPTSLSGTQFFAMPYHFTGSVAEDLIDDINLQGGVVESVTVFVTITDTTETYSLFTGGTNFALKAGEHYTILMQTGLANYIPSHY